MKEYLLVSDFDQTLSFNDSGIVLSELLGIPGFDHHIHGLSKIHLIQQGGELAYLLLHDPEYRRVRREHLIEVGKRIRLKDNIRLVQELLEDVDERHFSLYVISAAPVEVIQSALAGIVPDDHIIGTEFNYDAQSGEIQSIRCVPAGYGKVARLESLHSRLALSHDRIVYVGDGSSDVHVMMHVNRLGGLTIAVSENAYINQIAQRTVISDEALSVVVPILEDIAGWDQARIRTYFDAHNFFPRDWDKVTKDSFTICRAETGESLRGVEMA